MPNELLVIDKFNQGTISKISAEDLPKEAAIYSKNIDPEAPMGRLQGLLGASRLTSIVGPQANKSCFIDQDKNKNTLVYADGSNIGAFEDFHNDPTLIATILNNSIVATSLTPNGRAVHIGTGENPPKWLGYYKADPFSGKVTYTGAGINNLAILSNGYTGADKFTVKIKDIHYISSNYSLVDIETDISGGFIVTITKHGLTDEYVKRNTIIDLQSYTPIDLRNSTDVFYNGSYQITQIIDINRILVSQKSGDNVTLGTIPLNGVIVQGKIDTVDVDVQVNTNPTTSIIGFPEIYTIGNAIKIYFDGYSYNRVVGDTWVIDYATPVYSFGICDAEIKNLKDEIIGDNIFINMNVSVKEKGTDTTDSTFNNTKYYYGYSLVYDGIQDSPIAWRGDGDNTTAITANIGDFWISTNINIEFAYQTSTQRITGIKLWRATGVVGSYEPETEFVMGSFPPFPVQENR